MYEMFNRDLIASTQTATNYAYFGICARKSRKPVLKHSVEKPILLNFENLSKIFCPRLWIETKKIKCKRFTDNFPSYLALIKNNFMPLFQEDECCHHFQISIQKRKAIGRNKIT